jgi:hypothetical protein
MTQNTRNRSKISQSAGRLFRLAILATIAVTVLAKDPQADYSIVIGREDKHQIVRYDANSDIFKKAYYRIKEGKNSEWSLNFKSFIPVVDLPPACQHKWKKKHFWANIAYEVNGVCHRWEFNQGHIWRLLNPSKNKVEEIYTFKFHNSEKKLCFKFTTMEKGSTAFTQKTTYKKNETDENCSELITFFVKRHHFQITPYNPYEFSIEIEDPSRRHRVKLRQDSWIARNPIVNMKHNTMRVSINFATFLT